MKYGHSVLLSLSSRWIYLLLTDWQTSSETISGSLNRQYRSPSLTNIYVFVLDGSNAQVGLARRFFLNRETEQFFLEAGTKMRLQDFIIWYQYVMKNWYFTINMWMDRHAFSAVSILYPPYTDKLRGLRLFIRAARMETIDFCCQITDLWHF